MVAFLRAVEFGHYKKEEMEHFVVLLPGGNPSVRVWIGRGV